VTKIRLVAGLSVLQDFTIYDFYMKLFSADRSTGIVVYKGWPQKSKPLPNDQKSY